MEKSSKAHLKIIKGSQEDIPSLMGLIMKADSEKICHMEMDNSTGLMVSNTQDNGKTVFKTAWETKPWQMESN